MIITDFLHTHITEATRIVHDNYREERHHVPALPPIDTLPDLTEFANNGLSVAAFDDDRMVGFLCCIKPWNGLTTNAIGTFSPIHAHGAVITDRQMIYKRLYQAAAKKCAELKISWHSVSLYAHDTQTINTFFTYGFGLRCIDAIRPIELLNCAQCDGYAFRELAPDEKNKLLPLKNALINHLGESPIFMYFPPIDEIQLEKTHNRRKSRYFCAFQNGEPIAFLEVMDSGENFACDDKKMKNICGAFCLPQYRRKGVYQNLLNFVISALKTEGYTRLGVDFESINPTAYGFWLKYFAAYTNSVVRRIDEKILEVNA